MPKVMRQIRWSWAALACTSMLVWSNVSYGQSEVIADKLFQQARDLMTASDFAAACPLLERSYQLDPKDGTLHTLANCRDGEQKLTAALGHYRAYLRAYGKMTGMAKFKHQSRADNAQERITALEAEIPKVRFIWETAPPPESKIVVDGVEFRADTLDALFPLDPGTHQIVVQIPGEPSRNRTVTLAKGGSTIIDLTPVKPKEPDENKDVGTGPGVVRKPKPVLTKKTDPLTIVGFTGLGLGVVGLATGAITGILAMQQKEVVDARCKERFVCDPVGFAAVDRFREFGNTSTISFLVGGVFAGVGLTVVLVSRRDSAHAGANMRLKTAILPGNANLSLEGAF
jgi:hypothetical protein